MRSLIACVLLLVCCGKADDDEISVPAVFDPSRYKRHCDMSEDPLNLPDGICRERIDPPGYFDSYCKAASGIARDGACPKVGAVMGCVYAGGRELDWWYQGGKEQAARHCFLDRGTLVSP